MAGGGRTSRSVDHSRAPVGSPAGARPRRRAGQIARPRRWRMPAAVLAGVLGLTVMTTPAAGIGAGLDGTASAGGGATSSASGSVTPSADGTGTRSAEVEVPDFGTTHRVAELEVLEATQGTRVMSAAEIGQDIDVLLFQNTAGAGEQLTIAFEVPADDEYEVFLQPLLAPSYGRYDVSLNGEVHTELNLHHGAIRAGEQEYIATLPLAAGQHTMTFTATGQDPDATGQLASFMRLVLLDSEDRQERQEYFDSLIDDIRGDLELITDQIPSGPAPDDEALRARAGEHGASLDALAERAQDPQEDIEELGREIRDTALAVARLGDFVAARVDRPEAPFGIATADSMSLVYPMDLPCEACSTEPAALSLAQGERESIQTVLLPYAEGLTDVQARVSGVSGPGHAGNSEGPVQAQVDPLGSVFVENTDAVLPALGQRPENYEGWIPDPVRTDLEAVDVDPWVLQPHWLEIGAAADATPGTYTVTVEFTAQGHAAQELEVEVTVWPIEIPDEPDLATSMTTKSTEPGAPVDYTERWYMLEQLYDTETSQEFEELRGEYIDFLGDFMIEPDLIYNTVPPSVAELLEQEERIGLRQFNVLYLPGYADREFDPEDPGSWQPQIDEILEIVGEAMREYEEAGLADRAYIYGFDERSDTELAQAVLGQIQQEFPDLPVMTTFMDPTLGVDSGLTEEVDIWVPGVETFDAEAMAAAQQRGDEVYWYTHQAVRDPLPNWFNGYAPSDTRVLLGPMSHAMGVDGFLYYNIMRWVDREPMTDDVLSSWDPQTYATANGDGSLFYPGAEGPLASQRLHNYRDGMEDYNLLGVLQEAITEAEDGGTPEGDLEHARELLQAEAIVTDETEYTKDAAEYRQWREDVAAAIIALERSGDVGALGGALQDHIDAGDVAGALENQLGSAVRQAQVHVDGGRIDRAVGSLERFVGHLDEPRGSDTLTPRAYADLRMRAMVLLTFMD